MQLTDFARKVPQDVWALFAPILPPVVWCGTGCPPYDNRACLHAVLSVLVTGIGGQRLPPGFPSYKTVQRRLKGWGQHAACRRAWQQLAQRSETRQGLNWAEVWLDGSTKPAKKGASKRAPAPWSAATVGRRCTEPVTRGPCRWESW